MLMEKKALSFEELDAQTALELPSREMMALVNVIFNDVTIQVPIGIAASLCNINAAVLALQIVRQGAATCTAVADPDA